MKETGATQPGNSTAKAVIRYTMMPEIVPQAKEMVRGGFGFLAYLMAMVYYTVRILPDHHPYTQADNIGTFGIRDVITAAANRITFSRKNIDQVVIFFAILSAVVILFLQILSFLFFLLSGDAFAQSVFLLPDGNEETDIAYHLLREVFGIPDMFGTLEGGRTAMHQAFHMLLNFYNLAILLVAVLVFLYYVIVVVGETAQTGVPFGKRFSHIYAPLRLVIAVGLLVPLNFGLNGSQYITLFAAKIGSNFASNAWINFNEVVENPTGLENKALIAETNAPDISGLVSFMAVATTCREAYKKGLNKDIKMYQKEEDTDPIEISGTTANLANPDGSQDVKIIFGNYDSVGMGSVRALIPFCGAVNVPKIASIETGEDGNKAGELQLRYIELVMMLWGDNQLEDYGRRFAEFQYGGLGPGGGSTGSYHPNANLRNAKFEAYQTSIGTVVATHYQQARDDVDLSMREETKKLGWGGSGIWYNRIAQVNGAYTVATYNSPVPNEFPLVQEQILEEKKRADAVFNSCKAFEDNFSDNKTGSDKGGEDDTYLARVLQDAHVYWNCNRTRNSANVIIDTIAAIFGLEGLINIRQSTTAIDGEEVDIHPLAKLSALGRGMVENAIRSVGFAMGASAMGGILGILSPHLGESAQAASSMLVSVATIGLSIGFTTYYIIPFLPFIYFFFALGSWVKSIFEAMVGAPLWALAHLRIDGDGVPGKMASDGYFLIFEIFLRPILTVVGLLGAMAIFTAMANVLNDIFNIVVENTANVNLEEAEDAGNVRSVIDVFFFTCLYAIVLYMMALSSFKLINLIPNGILRWIGSGASAFSDSQDDPAGSLTQYAAIGGAKIGGQVAQGATQLAGAAGQAVAAVPRTFGLGGRGT